VKVGVRAGSEVIMCSAFISTGSARNFVIVSVLPLIGLTAVSLLVRALERPCHRASRAGLPVMYTVAPSRSEP